MLALTATRASGVRSELSITRTQLQLLIFCFDHTHTHIPIDIMDNAAARVVSEDEDYDADYEDEDVEERPASPKLSWALRTSLQPLGFAKRSSRKRPRANSNDDNDNMHESRSRRNRRSQRSSASSAQWPTLKSKPTSFVELSKCLIHYFDSRQQWEVRSDRKKPIDSSATQDDNAFPKDIKIKLGGKQVVSSSQSFSIEDAVGFSTHARLLIEARQPHRVVHANAAYVHLVQPKEHGSHTSYASLEAAVAILFETGDTLTLYAVWGSEKDFITHYLVELGTTTLKVIG